MLISIRSLLLALSIVVTAVGVTLLLRVHDHRWLVWMIVACGSVSIAALLIWRPSRVDFGGSAHESDNIITASAERRRELVRGTSMYLRELRYRYSIRLDPSEMTDRQPFSAEVNTIRLGFVPVIIIDNTNDRQGFGYAAFVHDGQRWRGPGLPCPGGQSDAVKHAARCVSPLAKEDETKF